MKNYLRTQITLYEEDKITLYEEDKKEEASMRCSLLHGSWDQILRRRPTVNTKKHRCKWRIFFKFCTQVCLGVPSINLWFVLSYLIKYAHNSIISNFSIFGIHRVIFLVRVFKFCTFWELVMFLDISSLFYRILIWLFFTIILTIHLLISLGTLLARENIEGTFWFFSNSVCTCS